MLKDKLKDILRLKTYSFLDIFKYLANNFYLRVILLLFFSLNSILLFTKIKNACAVSRNLTEITSVYVNYQNNTLNVYTIGKPLYKGYLFKKGQDNFFIIAFGHSVLFGNAGKRSIPFGDIDNVLFAQFATNPYVVHIVAKEKSLEKLPIKTIFIGNNKYDTIIYGTGTIETLSNEAAQPPKYNRQKPVFNVFIDAGHGGSDPGGIGPMGLPEAFVNLSIALKLRTLLNAKGIKTEIDRTSNVNVSLQQRVDEANNSGANLFIGLYCNSAIVPYLYGTTTYYFHKNSYPFAKFLNHYVSKHLNLKNDGTVMDDLYVIRFTKMPAVLIEYAYISNPFEEHLLASATFRQLIADAISNAIYKYYIADKRY
jgi:N-acetylmuramoyl-L-alanine amidase